MPGSSENDEQNILLAPWVLDHVDTLGCWILSCPEYFETCGVGR